MTTLSLLIIGSQTLLLRSEKIRFNNFQFSREKNIRGFLETYVEDDGGVAESINRIKSNSNS